MELTQIRYFMAVAQCENMSRAAAQFHISQPSLSKSISKLEAELGCKLFDRNGRKVTLNDEGRRFLKGASSMIWELDNAVFDVREMSHAAVSRITVGLIGANDIVMGHMASYLDAHPDIMMNIDTYLYGEQVADINLYDMLVYPDVPEYKKLKGYGIGREEYLLAFSDSYNGVGRLMEKAGRKGIAVDSLSGQDYVFMRYAENSIEFAWDVCAHLGVGVNVKALTDSQEVHDKLIASGVACGFVERGHAERFERMDGVSVVPIASKEFSREMMLCFKREKHLSSTAREFKEYMMASLGLSEDE